MSNRICNSKSQPYWRSNDWHPKHICDMKPITRRASEAADSFMAGVAMFLRAKLLGQETARRHQASAKKFRAQGQRGA